MEIKLRIKGIVQGVGFRPFVYRIASSNRLIGWVLNDTEGVLALVKGESCDIERFQQDIVDKAPSMAQIDSVERVAVSEKESSENYDGFRILPSPQEGKRQTFISPDIAACPECVTELKNGDDRRYGYPFINCTNCGPRYSIIEGVPYDRSKTTMKKFTMCPDCQQEYDNPVNRRFHAQPNACDECGPHYWLKKNAEDKGAVHVLATAKRLLSLGAIVAIKGIGGYHLACDARNEESVRTLRQRKHREAKPLAVMVGSLELAKRLCYVCSEEEKLLTSPTAPVVLLRKREEAYDLAESVAPSNPYLGVMLPYAPIHHLLLSADDVLVMTSGNISQEPISYKDDEAMKKLAGIADYFLGHDREIAYRVDDSVLRVIYGTKNRAYTQILRRSRGIAPAPLKFLPDMKDKKSVLACGAELKNTFAITKEEIAFVSEHIGDLENKPIYESYQKILKHYEEIFEIEPEIIACDMHPDYMASNYGRVRGKKENLPMIEVQHHHAHIAAVLAEYNCMEKVIGIAWDGTGYGDDGAIWGGEFMAADLIGYERKAHFKYLPLPGGNKAAREPWRQAVWILYQIFGKNSNKTLDVVPDMKIKLLLQATEAGLNAPLTSSVGRLFDTAAAILGICVENSYEGQAAVTLELMACKVENDYEGKILPYEIAEEHGEYIIDILSAMKILAEEGMIGKAPQEKICQLAMDFNATMADIALKLTEKISSDTGIQTVVLGGGVFQNRLLIEKVLRLLEPRYRVLIPEQVPINDGGLALGQAVIAIHNVRIN